MEPDANTFLTAQILNEGRPISYRALSRYLNVHCNLAKQLLHEFYIQQATTNLSGLCATYLVSGTTIASDKLVLNNAGRDDIKDRNIRSSPFLSSPVQRSSLEEIRYSKTVTLVQKHDLEAVKANYQQISSVHIYSVGPSIIQNLQLLSSFTGELTDEYAMNISQNSGKQYGIVQNEHVTQRTGTCPTVLKQPSMMENDQEAVHPVSKTTEISAVKPQACAILPVTWKQVEKPKLFKGNEREKKTKRFPAVKREQPDIVSSFNQHSQPELSYRCEGKQPPGIESNETDSFKQEESVGHHDDDPMMKVSGSEQENELIEEARVGNQTTKTERGQEEQLRQMMDEEMDTILVRKPITNANQKNDEMRESTAGEHNLGSGQVGDTQNQRKISPAPQLTSSGGRRRVKRKVLKKKMFKDEEGYLVTKEEPSWESFSEDEPLTQKERTPSSIERSTGKNKRVSGKLGQGNIKSFFGKR